MTSRSLRYEKEAAATLGRLEAEASDGLRQLMCDAIDTIIDRPDSREARAGELRGRGGKAVWKVDVFDRGADWAILWHHDAEGLVVIA